MVERLECMDDMDAAMSKSSSWMLSSSNGAKPLLTFGAVGNTSCRQLGQEFLPPLGESQLEIHLKPNSCPHLHKTGISILPSRISRELDLKCEMCTYGKRTAYSVTISLPAIFVP